AARVACRCAPRPAGPARSSESARRARRARSATSSSTSSGRAPARAAGRCRARASGSSAARSRSTPCRARAPPTRSRGAGAPARRPAARTATAETAEARRSCAHATASPRTLLPAQNRANPDTLIANMRSTRGKRACALLVAAVLAGCASAKPSGHDDGGGSEHDLSVGDLGFTGGDFNIGDLRGADDLQSSDDAAIVCDGDAGERACNGKCIGTAECCSAADCPQPTNGVALCSNNACGLACNIGYKACGSQCIPNASCCVGADCMTPPDGCHVTVNAVCTGGNCTYL